MPGNINSSAVHEARKAVKDARIWSMDNNLHSPHRRLIELRIEHADLDNLIDRCSEASATLVDDLALQRLKKRRLLLRDQIARLEAQLDPPEPA
jgi:hypothetical protein